MSIKFFDNRNQWHPRRFPYEFFGTVRQNVFGRNFWYSPPVLLIHKLLRYRKLSETRDRTVPLQRFWHCETKKIDKKSWHGPPKHNIFRYFSILEISDTLEGFPTNFFGTVRQNVFGRMSWYSPPPSFSSTNLFVPGNFPKRSSEGFPCNVFWHWETKKFDKKSWHIPFKHKIFRYPKSVTP